MLMLDAQHAGRELKFAMGSGAIVKPRTTTRGEAELCSVATSRRSKTPRGARIEIPSPARTSNCFLRDAPRGGEN